MCERISVLAQSSVRGDGRFGKGEKGEKEKDNMGMGMGMGIWGWGIWENENGGRNAIRTG